MFCNCLMAVETIGEAHSYGWRIRGISLGGCQPNRVQARQQPSRHECIVVPTVRTRLVRVSNDTRQAVKRNMCLKTSDQVDCSNQLNSRSANNKAFPLLSPFNRKRPHQHCQCHLGPLLPAQDRLDYFGRQ
jgi:hypothetical protein